MTAAAIAVPYAFACRAPSPDPDVPLQRLPENQQNKLGRDAAHAENLDWLTEARPRWYRSSDWAERGFCNECGSQMFYRMDDRP